MFTPTWKWSKLTNVFEMGWDHQLETHSASKRVCQQPLKQKMLTIAGHAQRFPVGQCLGHRFWLVRNGENLTKSPHAVYIPKWYSNQRGCSKWHLVLFSTELVVPQVSWNWMELMGSSSIPEDMNNIRHFAQVVQEPIFCQFVWFVLATHGPIPWCLEWNCLFHGPNTFTLLSTRNSWSSHRPLLPYTTEN